MDDDWIVDDVWRVRRSSADGQSGDWPKVVILHSFYRGELPSGENETVLKQYGWLVEAGVDVALVSVATDDLSRSPGYALRTAGYVASGGGLLPKRVLEELDPDVIHIHNLFPNISSRWIPESSRAVVVSLHNYRPLCAAATLSRKGQNCHLCIDHWPIHSLIHRCYRDSAIATVPMTVRALRGIDRHELLGAADVLLAPSEVVREAYASAGIDSIQVLLQPAADRGSEILNRASTSLLFIGRLTPEKGIMELLTAWPSELPMTVIGQGPLEGAARDLVRRYQLRVNFLGRVSDERLTSELRSASALVFPSTWREGAPAVYAEALSAGLPVISVKGNAVADFIQRDQTGIVLDALTARNVADAIEAVIASAPNLNSRCLQIYRRDYSKEVWLTKLRQAYELAVSRRSIKSTSRTGT